MIRSAQGPMPFDDAAAREFGTAFTRISEAVEAEAPMMYVELLRSTMRQFGRFDPTVVGYTDLPEVLANAVASATIVARLCSLAYKDNSLVSLPTASPFSTLTLDDVAFVEKASDFVGTEPLKYVPNDKDTLHRLAWRARRTVQMASVFEDHPDLGEWATPELAEQRKAVLLQLGRFLAVVEKNLAEQTGLSLL